MLWECIGVCGKIKIVELMHLMERLLMDKYSELKSEYESLLDFIKEYVPEVEQDAVSVYFTAAALKIWGSNLLCSPDYTELSTDYYLAKKLYDSFAPLEEDQVMLDMIDRYEATRKEVEEEIAEIRSGFPFNALSTINDRKKTEEYLAELRLRAARCEREKAELEAQIASMTEDSKKMTEESKNG